ncbi:MAG: arginine deiminase-related protein [Vampirovibrionales bacterium]
MTAAMIKTTGFNIQHAVSDDPVILMCPPDFFNVDYVINPWMNAEPVDMDKARRQWDALHQTLTRQLGVSVVLLEPVVGLPDLVFTANAAFVHGQKAVVSHFKHPERQGETAVFARWFAAHGYDVILSRVDGADVFFEGAGDALTYCNGTDRQVFAGYKTRTDIRSHELVSQHCGLPVASLELVSDHFYHIDVCLCPTDTGHLLYAPSAFDEYGCRVIEQTVPHDRLIPVVQEEARKFACNAISVFDAVVFNQGSTELVDDMRTKGLYPIELDLSEFIKSGGSAKCLTLRLV